MRIKAVVWAPLFAALCVTGCQPSPPNIAGTWTGSAQIKRPSTGNVQLDAQLAKADLKPVSYQLTLNPDKSYVEKIALTSIEGSWSLEGNSLTLTPLKVDGQDVEQAKKASERMASQMQINLPPQPGVQGPELATVSVDGQTISLPSIGTTVELQRSGSGK